MMNDKFLEQNIEILEEQISELVITPAAIKPIKHSLEMIKSNIKDHEEKQRSFRKENCKLRTVIDGMKDIIDTLVSS